MNLVKCKECKNEYDNTLKICPHCGYENASMKNTKIAVIVLCVFAIIFARLSIDNIFNFDRIHEDFIMSYMNELHGNIATFLHYLRVIGTTLCLFSILYAIYLRNKNEKLSKVLKMFSIIFLIIFQILPVCFSISIFI